jgi:glutamine synthetase
MSSNIFRDIFLPSVPEGKEGGAQVMADKNSFSDCCVAEYVWLDGAGKTRSKCKTISAKPQSADDCAIWMYNGTPCDQADPQSSDVYLVPRRIFDDPVRGAPHVLVVCESITSAMEPAKGNFRAECAEVMERFMAAEPWFGLEQEYVLCDDKGKPLPTVGGNYSAYCGRGTLNLPEGMRETMGDHYAMCLSAGIKICGMNTEQGAAQGEFQIGPCKGLEAADHMVAARHTLHKAAQKYRIAVSFKAMEKDVGVGSGLHCNFSARQTRTEGGLAVIEKICRALSRRQKEALSAYGVGNEERLNGKNDTSEMNGFKFGVADRSASIRIPRNVGITGKGYLEDRRPAANADPYRVTACMMRTAGEVLAAMTGK